MGDRAYHLNHTNYLTWTRIATAKFVEKNLERAIIPTSPVPTTEEQSLHLARLKAHQQATVELEVSIQTAQAAVDVAVEELSRRMWDEERTRAPVASGTPSREAPPGSGRAGRFR